MPSVVDVTYTDSRTGQRVRERRIQELPDDQVDYVRRREMEMVLAPRRDQWDRDLDYRREDDFYARPRGRRNDDFLAVDEYRPQRASSYRGAASRRRSPSSSSASSSDSDYDRRRRRRRNSRRARSAILAKEKAAEDDSDDGILFYSGRPRREGNFVERHFDPSYDGLIAAAAGAAIGAITARSFAHREGDEKQKKNLKTLGGALVGAAAFNTAENHYHVFTAEKQERKKEERAPAGRSSNAG